MLSWTSLMAANMLPHAGLWVAPAAADAVSVATPLAHGASGFTLWQLFYGDIPGMIGETSKLALLLGGVYLLARRVIDWRIPVTFIGTAAIAYWIKTGTLYSMESGTQNVLYQLLSGGLLIGAFFMATDYVTSPMTRLGRLIMGVGCGLFLFIIREYSSYPEGCSFAILFMNVLTPLIDRLTGVKPFGYEKIAKQKSPAKEAKA
jgi:electron transport complex protein RnfD